MANMRVQVFYQKSDLVKWTNVYHVGALTVSSALSSFVTEAVPLLISILDPACSLVKVLVSDPDTDAFTEASIATAGDHFGSGTLLPLFNRVKLIVQTAGEGRPDLKYLGGLVGEDNSDEDGVSSGAIVEVVSAFTDMISAMIGADTPLVSDEGDNWVSVTVQKAIQMRQLHRKRRKVVV